MVRCRVQCSGQVGSSPAQREPCCVTTMVLGKWKWRKHSFSFSAQSGLCFVLSPPSSAVSELHLGSGFHRDTFRSPFRLLLLYIMIKPTHYCKSLARGT